MSFKKYKINVKYIEKELVVLLLTTPCIIKKKEKKLILILKNKNIEKFDWLNIHYYYYSRSYHLSSGIII